MIIENRYYLLKHIINQKESEFNKILHDIQFPIQSLKQIILDPNLVDTPKYNPKKESTVQKGITKNLRLSTHTSQCLSNAKLNVLNRYSLAKSFSGRAISNSFIDASQLLASQHLATNLESDINNYMEIVKNDLNIEIDDADYLLRKLKNAVQKQDNLIFRTKNKQCSSQSLLNSLRHCNYVNAQSQEAKLELKINTGFPLQIDINSIDVKRILNNLITSSLLHSKANEVDVSFQYLKLEEVYEQFNHFYYIGYTHMDYDNYLIFKVVHKCNTIPESILNQMFYENINNPIQVEGVNYENFEEYNLSLQICKNLCDENNVTLFYYQEKKNSKLVYPTTYALCVQVSNGLNNFKSTNSEKSSKTIEEDEFLKGNYEINIDFRHKHENYLFNHVCNSLILTDDNKAILKHYSKYLDKNSIPYTTFTNCTQTIDHIKNEISYNCPRCKYFMCFIDIFMPITDGIELARRIRSLETDRRLILCYVNSEEPEEQLKEEGLFDHYYLKPMDLQVFKDNQINLKAMNYVDCQDSTNEDNMEYNNRIVRELSDSHISEKYV